MGERWHRMPLAAGGAELVTTGARRPCRDRLWVIACCALLTGCQGVSVWHVVAVPRLRTSSSHGRPDVEEYSWLDERQPRGAGTPLVAAKASHAVGHGAEGASRDIAAAYELDAAASASTILAALPVTVEGSGGAVDDARALEVRDLYNAALEDLLRMTGGRRIRPDARWRDRLAA